MWEPSKWASSAWIDDPTYKEVHLRWLNLAPLAACGTVYIICHKHDSFEKLYSKHTVREQYGPYYLYNFYMCD